MGHGKETPRQKMIGMMYLVLTALLALNVSKDILNAFAMVDEGLAKTTENFAEKNDLIYDEFDKMVLSNPVKVKPFKEKADEVKKRANELYTYIHNLKIKIVTLADGKEGPSIKDNKIDVAKINSKDNSDKPAQIMIVNKEGQNLKKKIDEFRNYILSIVDKKDEGTINAINASLDTKDPESKDASKHSWESEHFEHWPLIAVTTIMSNLQSNVRNAESDVLKYLYNQIDASSFKFNKLEATIISNSSYILKGGEYNAEVFIAASDTTKKPVVYIGPYETFKTSDGKIDYKMTGRADSLPIDPKNGRGIFKRTGSSVGKQTWGGIIMIRATDGSTIKKPFKQEYMVAEAMLVVSPTYMNVFYVGVDNPVSISVPGVPADKIYADITNGVIQKTGNSWVVKPRSPGMATVLVTAEIDGKRKPMGGMEFRVKNMPDPVAKVGGLKGGGVDRNTLGAQNVVVADMENFDFKATFTVTGFTISANIKGFARDESSKSNRITDEQKNLIKSLDKGTKCIFTDITAVGPDGKVRDLNGIILKIK